MPPVGLALGLFLLPQKMRAKQRSFGLAILTNKYLRWFVAAFFAMFNIITLVTSALEKSNGGIPRKYWPVSISVVIGIGIVYWSGFRLLSLKYKRDGPTLGRLVGFQVHYDDRPQAAEPQVGSEKDDPAPEVAYNDIEWRSVDYEVHPPPSISTALPWSLNIWTNFNGSVAGTETGIFDTLAED